MKTRNRFTSLQKRILSHKVYLLMLLTLIMLALIYRCLPEKKRSTNIKAAIFFETPDKYSDALKKELNEMNSIYTFIFTDSKEEMISLVKSADVECGYYFPDSFFTNYIRGNVADNPATAYVLPSTTLSATIGETLFSNILKITSGDLLAYTVNIPELSDELSGNLYEYLDGNEIFTLASTVSGEFNYKDMVYKIDLPVFEVALLFLIVSSMLGLLLFERDSEKNMFITMKKNEISNIKIMSVITAILPIMLAGALSMLITYGLSKKLIFLFAFSLISALFSYVLGAIVKKSVNLSKVIPIVTFLSTTIIFLKDMI